MALEYKMCRAKANRILSREHAGHSKQFLKNPRDYSTLVHHQMVNIEIRLPTFLAAKDGESL